MGRRRRVWEGGEVSVRRASPEHIQDPKKGKDTHEIFEEMQRALEGRKRDAEKKRERRESCRSWEGRGGQKSSTISSTHPFSQRRAASRPQIFFRFRVHFSYDQRTQTTIMRSTRSNTIPDVSFKRPCKRGAQADLSPFPFPLSLLRTPSSSESRRRYCST